jgi:hypothetical protein
MYPGIPLSPFSPCLYPHLLKERQMETYMGMYARAREDVSRA